MDGLYKLYIGREAKTILKSIYMALMCHRSNYNTTDFIYFFMFFISKRSFIVII